MPQNLKMRRLKQIFAEEQPEMLASKLKPPVAYSAQGDDYYTDFRTKLPFLQLDYTASAKCRYQSHHSMDNQAIKVTLHENRYSFSASKR
jgi:hypothetical protein